MTITKNCSGVYVARVDTIHGKRTINLRCRDKELAKRIARESRIAEGEFVARIALVKKEIVAQVVLGRKVKAGDALTEWLEWLTSRVSEKHAFNLRIILAAFLRETKSITEFVHLITDRKLDTWVNDPNSTSKASTRKLKISALRSFFEFCSTRNYAVANPATELRVNMAILRHEQKETATGKPFVESQYERILAGYETERQSLEAECVAIEKKMAALLAGNPRSSTTAFQKRLEKVQAGLADNLFWRCAVQLGWQTGLRFGDICQLEWASLEKPLGLVVWTDKTNARVELRLKPGLSSLLRSLERRDKTWVFPEQHEIYSVIRKRSRFSIEFSRFITSLGIEDHSFHSLRHSYASKAKREGMPIDHIRQRLGHSTTAMTKRYVHP